MNKTYDVYMCRRKNEQPEQYLFGKPVYVSTLKSLAADSFLAAFRQSIERENIWLTPRLHRVTFDEQFIWYDKKDKEDRLRAVLELSLHLRIKGGYATTYDKLKYFILSRMDK